MLFAEFASLPRLRSQRSDNGTENLGVVHMTVFVCLIIMHALRIIAWSTEVR